MAAKPPKYLSRPAKIVIRPAPGWNALLEAQMARISGDAFSRYKFSPVTSAADGVVEVDGIDFRQAIEWTMRLTVAHDVEWVAWEGKCGNWGQLAQVAADVRAQGFLREAPADGVVERQPVQVTVSANSSFVVSSAQIRKQFVEALGVSLAPDSPLRLRLDLYRNRLRVLVSLAGEPLYKRGYKKHFGGAVAPLPEHQAAACVELLRGLLAGSSIRADVNGVFVPFAGTGTFAFEWLVSELGLGPGSFPRRFAFDDFAGVPSATLEHLRRRLAHRHANGTAHSTRNLPPVVCLERHEGACGELRANVLAFTELAGIPPDAIRSCEGDFFKAEAAACLRPIAREGGHLAVLLNPPYGQRLKIASEARKYFARIAARMIDLEMQAGTRFSGVCIVPDEAASAVFVRTLKDTHRTKTVHFTHGGADVRLVSFSPSGA